VIAKSEIIKVFIFLIIQADKKFVDESKQ